MHHPVGNAQQLQYIALGVATLQQPAGLETADDEFDGYKQSKYGAGILDVAEALSPQGEVTVASGEDARSGGEPLRSSAPSFALPLSWAPSDHSLLSAAFSEPGRADEVQRMEVAVSRVPARALRVEADGDFGALELRMGVDS